MLHTMFGRRINAPLALLLQDAAQRVTGTHIGSVDEEDGILLYSYGEGKLEGCCITSIRKQLRKFWKSCFPLTPCFQYEFRYNAARCALHGMRRNKDGNRCGCSSFTVRKCWKHCCRRNIILWCGNQTRMYGGSVGFKGLLRFYMQFAAGYPYELQLDTPSPLSLPPQWRVKLLKCMNIPTTPDPAGDEELP